MKRTVRIWWVVAGTFLLFLVCALGLLFYLSRQQLDRLESTTEASARSTAVFASQWISDRVQKADWQPVQEWLTSYSLSGIIFHFQVRLPDGRVAVDNQAGASLAENLVGPLAQQVLEGNKLQAVPLGPQLYLVAAPVPGADGRPAAVLVDQVDWSARYQQSQADLLVQMGGLSIIILLVLVLSMALMTYFIINPMRRLRMAADTVSRRGMISRVPSFPVHEMQQTSQAINEMLDRLDQQRSELDQLNQQLEQTVAQRTHQLEMSNRELLTLNRISSLALEAKSTAEASRAIVDEVSAATGFPIVIIENYVAARQVMVLEAAAGSDLPVGTEQPAAGCLSGLVAASGSLLSEADITSRPDYPTLEPAHFAACTYVGVPMIGEGGVLGVISLYHPQSLDLENGLVGWVTTLANHIVALRERLQAQADLVSSQERFELALEGTGLGVWDWDIPSGSLLVNNYWAVMLGCEPAELAANIQVYQELMHPDDYPGFQAAVKAHLEGKSPVFNYEMRLKTKAGGWKWVLSRGNVASRDSRGQALRLVGTQRDIDERKASEEELHRRDAILQAVTFAAERFLSSASWEESLPPVLERLGQANRASRVFIFEAIQDVDGAWLYRQHSEWAAPGISPEIEKGASPIVSFRDSGLRRWEEELSRGRPIWGRTTDFLPSEQKHLNRLKVRSRVVIPVFVGSRWWGFIGLDDCLDERGWSPAETDALKVAGSILGAAIQRQQTEGMVKRLYETEREQRQTAQALREIGTVFSATLSYDSILDQILDELPRMIPYDAAYVLLVTPTFDDPSSAMAPATKEAGPELERTAVVARQRGYEDYDSRLLQTLPSQSFTLSETPALRWMAEKQQPMVVSDTRAIPGIIHLVAKETFSSWAAAPIMVQGRVVAFFVLEKTEPRFYRSQQAETLALFASQVALALQNARLYTEALGALEREQNLNEVTRAISSALELPHILQTVVRLAAELCGADAGTLGIISPDGDTLLYPYLHNLPVSLPVDPEPRGQGMAWEVIESGKSMLLENYSDYPNATPGWTSAGLHAVIAVSLVAGDVCLGTLGLFSYHPDKHFTGRDLALMESVGRQAGIAIQNARLFEAAEKRARESETLRLAVAEVTSALEFDQVLDKLLSYLVKVVPYDSSTIFLYEGDHLRAVAGRGLPHPDMMINHIFPANNPLFVEIKNGGSLPLILEDAQADPRFAKWGNATETRGWMGLPLRVHGAPIGYLTVDSSKVGAYRPQDATLVQAFADEVAIAIDNARLFQQVQHLAITDPLTTLYNRRYFFDAARREMERARRYQRPMGMVMLDIDHFKRVNDTYGHLAGDRVLVAVAARGLEKLRTADIAARYGGEEFVFLLPEIDLESAGQVAERLRVVIMEQPIDIGDRKISISVSLGVAELDEDCVDMQALVRRADIALYAAKDSGRGRVTFWTKEMGAIND